MRICFFWISFEGRVGLQLRSSEWKLCWQPHWEPWEARVQGCLSSRLAGCWASAWLPREQGPLGCASEHNHVGKRAAISDKCIFSLGTETQLLLLWVYLCMPSDHRILGVALGPEDIWPWFGGFHGQANNFLMDGVSISVVSFYFF